MTVGLLALGIAGCATEGTQSANPQPPTTPVTTAVHSPTTGLPTATSPPSLAPVTQSRATSGTVGPSCQLMLRSASGSTASFEVFSDRAGAYYEYLLKPAAGGRAIIAGGGPTDFAGSAIFAVGGAAGAPSGTVYVVDIALTDSPVDLSHAEATAQLTGLVTCSGQFRTQ
jgi:hypothetical protein